MPTIHSPTVLEEEQPYLSITIAPDPTDSPCNKEPEQTIANWADQLTDEELGQLVREEGHWELW